MHNTTGKVGTIEEKITPWTSPTRSAKVLISGVVTMVATTNLILLAPVFRNISLLKASRVTFTIQNQDVYKRQIISFRELRVEVQ